VIDRGWTHVALLARDIDRSAAFYARYANMTVVHSRGDESGKRVAWLSDRTRPFVLVLIEADHVDVTLSGWAHLGVGCPTRADVDRLTDQARAEGILLSGPTESGPPVGYWAMLRDPDGHNLEPSFGQEVGLAVEKG
jgi:catechol 2,3-dioxygenase-like lactoylglutathione lyase family enzyme